MYSNCFVHATENKKSVISEIERAMKKDSDPRLRQLMKLTSSEGNFLDKQRQRLKDADVIGVTCASAFSALLTGIQSQVLILDEVSQMTEALSLLPLASAKPCKILLIGDPKQLPPALAVPSAASLDNTVGDFSRTMFDRLRDLGLPASTLRIQYRCHPKIAGICSRLFYDGTLQSGVSASDRQPLIPHLETVVKINNVGGDTRAKESSINHTECELICQILSTLQETFSSEDATSAGDGGDGRGNANRGLPTIGDTAKI